jgi:UMF1 family MFS transporter
VPKKVVNAWCWYDWANSAFATTIMAAMFPPFFRRVATAAGLAEHTATAYWGYTTSVALLLVALTAPVLGAVADNRGSKKRFLGFFAGLGVLFTATFVFIGSDSWRVAALLYIGANIGFAGSIVFYESLLPHLATGREIDRISARGYALGYAGGGILLVLNTLWVMKPHFFGMPDSAFALKASFLSVAVWWGIFAVPLFRLVPEPAITLTSADSGNPLRAGFARLLRTFRDIAHYRQLFRFLIAYWLYNDGIGTIIKMATAYGDEIGIGLTDMVSALILTQFVGIPCSLLFGRLAGIIGPKRAILLGLGVYSLICVLGFFMRSALHFYALALLVGTVQGGCQALSRSLFGSMVPRSKSGEFFGFYSTSGKIAGIAGPLLFGLLSQMFGQSRWSIFALVIFFVAGGLMLRTVNVEEGIRSAQTENKVS